MRIRRGRIFRNILRLYRRRKTAYSIGMSKTSNTHRTMNNDSESRMNFIEQTVRDFLILIDTCSLLGSPVERFLQAAAPYLQKYGKHVVVPKSVVQELEKYRNNPKVPDRAAARDKVKHVTEYLNRYRQMGVLAYYGDDKDCKVADQVFLSEITRLRVRHNVLLITQDRALATEVSNLGHSSSVRGIKKIRVGRVDRAGKLVSFSGSSNSGSRSGSRSSSSGSGSRSGSGSMYLPPIISNMIPFAKGTQVRVGKGELLPVHGLPGEGSTLKAKSRDSVSSVRLVKRLGGGGEGDVYETNGALVAKIYKPQCNTSYKRDKLQMMIEHRAECPGVCFPKSLLYNEKDEFVGYLMPKAKGCELQCLFNKALLKQKFPNWKKQDLVQLCLAVVQKVEFLHSMNIILGDINANNILVASPTEVYFVDTDSYQIQDYPCPVGKEYFTAPEIMGRNYSEFLRTPAHENFALAVLLFMVLMMGKHPYSRMSGGSPADNIRSGLFPYAAGEINGKNTPMGDWVYIWSHLTRKLKESFHSMFQAGGEHYQPAQRLTDKDWKCLLNSYLHGLRSGMLENDPMSNELYPSRHKISKDTPENTGKKSSGSSGRSSSGGKKRPALGSWADEIKIHATCCDCGKPYDVTNGEYEFFTSKGLNLPTRCKNCRVGNNRPVPSKGILESLWDFFFG